MPRKFSLAGTVTRADSPCSYVEQLEEQLQQTSDGLRKLYGIAQGEEKWEGPPLAVSANGYPLTHEILERLGVLKPDLKAIFEENPEVLRYKLLLEQREKSQEQRFQTQIPLPGYPAPDNQLMGAYPTSSQLPPTPPTPVQNSDGQAPFNPNSGFNQIDPVISLDPSVLHPQGQSWGQAAPQPLFGDATGLVPYGMPSDYNGLWYPGATDNDPQAMPYYDPTLQ